MPSGYTGRPEPGEFSHYYVGYVGRVPEGDIVAILRGQLRATQSLLAPLTDAQADFAYAPGKWTIKEVIGHIADTERIMAGRALRVARGDTTPLPGFDENEYVPQGRFGERSLAALLADLEAVRASTVALFAGLPANAWERRGTASDAPVSVRALACVIAGHELHHRALIETRYLAAMPSA